MGTAKIIGRVHMASLKIGDNFYNCSFTILDQQVRGIRRRMVLILPL